MECWTELEIIYKARWGLLGAYKLKEKSIEDDSIRMKKSILFLLLLTSLNAVTDTKCGADENKMMQNRQHKKAVSSYVNVISKRIVMQFDKNIMVYKRANLFIQIKPIVNLHDPKKSSIATQKITENLLHEMFVKGFKMLDSSAKNATCEMLGTYTNYKNGMLINARVVDKKSREVYTSAQVFVTQKELKSINKIYNKYSWFSENN